MDFSELTKIIFDRVQKVEPENVVKIIGCMLIKEPGEQEMVQLAFGPDATLLSKIADYKVMLGKLPSKISDHQQCNYASLSPGLRPFSSPATFPSYWDPQIVDSDHYPPIQNLNFGVGDDYHARNQAHLLNFDGQLDPMNQMNPVGNHYYQDALFPPRASRRTPSLPEFPIKPCHYFSKGFCKHGASCRYFHGHPFADGYSSPMFSPNGNEFANEDQGFSPGSLEKLELEITELLRSRRGMPVSIASLPMLYFEKYGRNLQADGYLTESQRHGKSGFSLTKLLARLKNSIRLIDRPHGQHAVILAEDASRYMECNNDRRDPGAIVASSHQIYLTFPAESTFTEDDVSNYFKQYGPVRDVRIPSQEKRMFGFVSFLYPETVNMILMKRNPHYICGARVLVKQYREKSRIVDRNYTERIRPSMYYPSHYLEMDPELHSMPRESESSRLLKKHLLEEQEKIFELERRRLSELSIEQKPINQPPFFSYDMEEFKLPEGHDEFPMADHFSYTLDVLNNGSTSDEKARYTSNGYSDQESNQIDLPESPFASPPPVGSSISAVM